MLTLAVLVPFFLVLALWLDLPRLARRWYRRWKFLKQIPYPEHLPYHWLLGHLPAVYCQDEALMTASVLELNKPCNKNLSITKLWLGPVVIVDIKHPKYIGSVLKEPKSYYYSMLVPWLGEGLLIAEGKKWFRNRRLLTPAFHYEILKGYVSVYNRCLSVLLDKWSESARKEESVLLFNTLSSMSLDIIMQCAFSFKSDCQRAKVQHPYVKACSELVHLCSDRGFNPLYLIDWVYWLSPQGRKTRKMCKLVHEHAEKIITERRAALCRHNNKGLEISKEDDKAKHLDFLDILLIATDEEGMGMSDLEIRNEVDTFMFEGHDTTTSAMSWTLYCLAQHPQHQDKIRDEVRCVLKGREWLDYEDLKQLNYTMWCIKESMRLYPPVFYFIRRTTEEVKIDKYVIPKDVDVTVQTLLIHRNANIWENPMEYDPLRFQPSNMDKHGPYDYIPFSAGSRNCIGQNFAMNEMKVVIGTIVNRFLLKVDKTHHVEMVPKIVLRTKNDIKIQLFESTI